MSDGAGPDGSVREDARNLDSVLLHGTPEARFRLAEVLAVSDGEVVDSLASTVRSDEYWLLRARCLEVLGLVASIGGERRARSVLGALLGLQGAEEEKADE